MKLSNGFGMISGKPVFVFEQHPDALWMWYDCSVLEKVVKNDSIFQAMVKWGALPAPRLPPGVTWETGQFFFIFF